MTHSAVYLIEDSGLFSAAEKRELKAMLDGLTVEQAAKKHFVSPDTVKTHRTAVRQKTGQHSAATVVAYCLATGLVKVFSENDVNHALAAQVHTVMATVSVPVTVGGHRYGLY